MKRSLDNRAEGECIPFTTTPLQQKATAENFAIYMLRGWMRFVQSKYIKRHMTKLENASLLYAMECAIEDIKAKQLDRIFRKENKRRGVNHG